MYTFSQLLARNALFGLVFFVVITLAAILMQQSTLKKQQLDHGNRLSVFVNTLDESDKQQLATTLNKLANYAELTITSGEERAKGVIQTATLNPVIDILMPPTEQLTNNKHEVIIRYRVNFSDNIRLLLNLSALLFILLAIFCTVAASMSAKRYSRFLNGIGQQIKKELQMVTSNSEDPNFEQVFKLDELSDGINEIRAFIEKQQSTAVTLENQAYVDSLTKLNNRSRFVQYFENQIHNNSEKSFGVLIVTRCSELQTINQIRGYNEGDRYICKIAEIMKSVSPTFGGAEIYRLNSSDFATILPNMTLADGENFAKTIAGRFNEYQQASDLDSVAYSGLVAYDGSSPLGELLALADTGISVAQTQHINAWFSQKDSSILEATSASYGNQNWRQEIENVLENQRVSLMVQPIKPNSRNNKVYGEILARFLNSNNEMLPTASFIAMAEKLDKIVSIDRLIIESAMNEIATKNLTEGNFGINISARSIHDEHFLIWLERRLLRETSISSRLIFEISEYGLQQNIKSSKRFIDMVHRTGARITVERFGVGLTSFKFFRDLKPDFIKMDSTYTRDIDEDKNNQYFLRLMVDLAHRLSIQVLAESVETLEEKHALEKLFIDGCQGYYISKPTPL